MERKETDREFLVRMNTIIEDPLKIIDVMDIHGFILKSKKEYDETKDLNEKKMHILIKRNNARIEKWRAFLPKLEDNLKKKNIITKLKKKIRKGIPDCLRGIIWSKLSRIELVKKDLDAPYSQLKNESSPYETEIKLDVSRTFPNHTFFKPENHSGQMSLQIVLKALSIVFNEMGYCQGLNFIAATFLLYLNDEETFIVLVSLMIKYDLLKYYQNLLNIRRPFFVFEQLAKHFLPKLSAHLEKSQLTADIYAPGWFLTLYVSILPFNLVLRILDIFLYEGYKIIYRVGLAILKIKEEKILTMKSMDKIMLYLKDFKTIEFENEDQFIKIVTSFVFKRKDIKKYESIYDLNNQPEEPIKNSPTKR